MKNWLTNVVEWIDDAWFDIWDFPSRITIEGHILIIRILAIAAIVIALLSLALRHGWLGGS